MPSSDPLGLRSVTHTSQSHPLVVVPMNAGGWTLYATIPPGCKGIVSHEDYGLIDIERDMSADVEALASYGIGRLVSMMAAEDILSSGMGGLIVDLEGYGIDWTHIPFPSRRLPDRGFPQYLDQQVKVIRRDLEAGVKVAIHGAGWNLAFTRSATTLRAAIEGKKLECPLHHCAITATVVGRILVPM